MYKIKYTGTIIARYPRIGTVIAKVNATKTTCRTRRKEVTLMKYVVSTGLNGLITHRHSLETVSEKTQQI